MAQTNFIKSAIAGASAFLDNICSVDARAKDGISGLVTDAICGSSFTRFTRRALIFAQNIDAYGKVRNSFHSYYGEDSDRERIDGLLAIAASSDALEAMNFAYALSMALNSTIDFKDHVPFMRKMTDADRFGRLTTVTVASYITSELERMNPQFGKIIPALGDFAAACDLLASGRVGMSVTDNLEAGTLSLYVSSFDTIFIRNLPGRGESPLTWSLSIYCSSGAQSLGAGLIIHELLHAVHDFKRDPRPMPEIEADSHTLQSFYAILISGEDFIRMDNESGGSVGTRLDALVRQLFPIGDHANRILQALDNTEMRRAVNDRAIYWFECLAGKRTYDQNADRKYVERFIAGYRNNRTAVSNIETIYDFEGYAPIQDLHRLNTKNSKFGFYDFKGATAVQIPIADLPPFFEEQEPYVREAIAQFRNLDSSMLSKVYDGIVQNAVYAVRFYIDMYYYYSRSGMAPEAGQVLEEKLLPLLLEKNWTMQKASFDGLNVYKIREY